MEIATGRRADYGSPPHVPRRSPFVFPTYSQPTSPSQDPSTSILGGNWVAYTPRWRGEAGWQRVRVRGDLRRMKYVIK